MIRLADTHGGGSRGNGSKISRVWYVDTEDEVFQCVRDNLSYRGFAFTGDWDFNTRDPNTLEAGFEVAITYGWVNADDDDVSEDEYGADKAKWDFEPTFQQTAAEKHPEINLLIDEYGGEEDPQTHRVTFTRLLKELPRDNARGLLGKNYKDASGQIKNPLYGFDQSGYITMGGIASARFITSNLSSAMRGVGKVFKRLPGNAPDYGLEDDRDFIKMPPSINEIAKEIDGNRWYEIVHQFMLSDIGGWPPGVYKFIEV